MSTNKELQLAMGATEWLLLLMLSVLWGGSFFFFKILVDVLPPFTVVLGRVGLAAIALNLFLLAKGEPMPSSPRLWRQFFAMGTLNNVIPFTLIVFGETRMYSWNVVEGWEPAPLRGPNPKAPGFAGGYLLQTSHH
jgi:drug/metabolite transporter (DMT)-like permease